MSNPKSSASQSLRAAQLAVLNSLTDPEIKTLVAEYGYTTTKLNKGKALYEAAVTTANTQRSSQGDQKASTAAYKQADAVAHDAYQALAKVARATLPKPDLTTLGLDRPMPTTLAPFLQAAYTLFDNAGSVALLAEFGYDAERLAAERAKIEALEQADQAQEIAKGDKQQATQDQQAALAALNEWVAQYLKIAKVALRGKQQLLEKIGVVTRTTKTAAQRAAPKKAAATRAARKSA